MIDWNAFAVVVVAAGISAFLLVTVFSLALRLGDGAAAWRRPLSIGLYVLCALIVLFGIYLIVPTLHRL